MVHITQTYNLSKMVVYQDPPDSTPIDERVVLALADGHTKTFAQLEILCGLADPAWAMTPEKFSTELDEAVRRLVASGKVIIVARRPELCFRKGTALDEIVMGIGTDDGDP
ncbi:MAG: hypothetical protein AB7L09_01495 [Nitrospira sp.]